MQSSQQVMEEISSVEVGSENVVGSAFVIPIEAAIPAELEQLKFSSGTLYSRLSALDTLPEDQDFGLVLLSGQELIDIAPSWNALTEVKKVYVLLDLPGVRYNTLFVLGYKQAGIPTISWTSVSAGLSERVRTRQRLVDTSPFIEARISAPKASIAGSSAGDELEDDFE